MDLTLYAIVKQITDLLQKIVNALKSAGKDMLNVNTAGADIMQPVDVQGSAIMVPVDWQGVAPETVKASMTLLASGTRTSSDNTSDIDILYYRNLDILIDVTAVSGTSPTLDVYIDGKFTAVGKYYPIASQTGITATGQWLLQLRNIPYRYIRVRWAIGGTSPSFTFGVYAEASL